MKYNEKLKRFNKFSFNAILLSLMIIFNYLEIIFPFSLQGIGIKIGLSNILTIISIKKTTFKDAFLINILRLLVIGILFSNLIRFIISISGFFCSFIVMYFLFKYLKFSIITTSIFSAVFHNIGQIISIYFITSNKTIFILIPSYILIGILTGFLIGILCERILKHIRIIF